ETFTFWTMPATLVLRGVRSPRTYASSVTCSMRPPSQAFQFLVSVAITATASRTTTTGVTYFCQVGLAGGAGACSAWAGDVAAGVVAAGVVAGVNGAGAVAPIRPHSDEIDHAKLRRAKRGGWFEPRPGLVR